MDFRYEPSPVLSMPFCLDRPVYFYWTIANKDYMVFERVQFNTVSLFTCRQRDDDRQLCAEKYGTENGWNTRRE